MVTKCHEKFNGTNLIRTCALNKFFRRGEPILNLYMKSLLSTGIASAEKTSHRDTERDHENY